MLPAKLSELYGAHIKIKAILAKPILKIDLNSRLLLRLLHSFLAYIQYRLRAKSLNAIHSPFVFSFCEEVLFHPHRFYAFEAIEAERKRLLADPKVIRFQELGARKRNREVALSTLASASLMPEEKAMVLFQLAHWLQAKNAVELGTCLGITTSYLAHSCKGRVYTFEGVEALAAEAVQVWHRLKLRNIYLVEGNIDQTLPSFLSKYSEKPDLIVIDANHQYEPTWRYFHQLLPYVHNNTCMVFDDIHWSAEMSRVWNEIVNHPAVTVSIDVFGLGFVFFRKESLKEHFVIHW